MSPNLGLGLGLDKNKYKISSGGGEPVLWTPDDISTVAWYDASQTSSISLINNRVSSWVDRKGLGLPLTQNVENSRPTLDNFLSGSLLFSNTNFLQNAYTATTYNIYIVLSSLANNQLIHYPIGLGGSKGLYYGGVFFSQNTGIYDGVDNFNLATVSINSPNIISLGLISSVFGSFNGNNVVNFSSTSNSITTFNIGRRSDNNWFFNGYISEILILDFFDNVINDKIIGYLAHKRGLTSNLPSGHPYKVNPPYV